MREVEFSGTADVYIFAPLPTGVLLNINVWATVTISPSTSWPLREEFGPASSLRSVDVNNETDNIKFTFPSSFLYNYHVVDLDISNFNVLLLQNRKA
jgi:hypothetical protein